ncbi:MAG TPA: helix-turn-helix transcriptional regulator [Hyphomonas sp.]|nr:helix-turn-helix transcriptional regulator [Hyphomonas sp.]
MHFPELENLPPQKQMPRFLQLAFVKQNSTPAELAEKLGYARDTMIVQWMNGTAKVPLQQVSAISCFFECDISHVLGPWLAQECPDDLNILHAAKRLVGFWEFSVINVAREVYGYYDE